jgi:hypothetical protein
MSENIQDFLPGMSDDDEMFWCSTRFPCPDDCPCKNDPGDFEYGEPCLDGM